MFHPTPRPFTIADYDPHELTISQLVIWFRQSVKYKGWTDHTRDCFNYGILQVEDYFGDWPCHEVTPRALAAWQEANWQKAAATSQRLSYIRSIFDHALRYGAVEYNPALFIKGHVTSTAHRTWPEDYISLVITTAPKEIARPILWQWRTCLRCGDVLRIAPNMIADHYLNITESKTGKQLFIPLHNDLQVDLLEHPPIGDRLFYNFIGAEWRGTAAFAQALQRWQKRNELSCDYTTHGIRRAGITALINAGATATEVSAITGQSQRTVDYYSSDFNRLKLARSAMAKLDV